MPRINNLQDSPNAKIAELERQLAALKAGNSAEEPGGSRQIATRGKRKKKREVQYLSPEELEALFRAIRAGGDARDLALFEVAYHRGLRASEVGLVQVPHLRLTAKRLYVTRLKGGISGEFPITEREVRALKAFLKVRGSKPGALFLSRNSKAISRRRLDELMKTYGEAANLPTEKQHFHCLRHSCGTALLEHDVPIEQVQDHLGHTDIRNTMIYARVTNRKRQQTGERLQREW